MAEQNDDEDSIHDPMALALGTEQLYKHVGRAIVALSNIENLMAMIFISVTRGMTTDEASDLFYSYQGFDQKFKIVSYAIRQNDWGDEFQTWQKLCEKLQEHKLVRNLAAHQGMRFVEDKSSSGGKKVILTSPWFKKGRKGRELEIADVAKSADGLEAIQKEMWQFVADLGPEKE